MKFELMNNYNQTAVIKVIGVGGGGNNAVNHMVESELQGIEFVCADTDTQALKSLGARIMLQLGGKITQGLGAGANPEIGKQAALEDRERIEEVLEGTDMVFIIAGMSGGTGTGAAPVIAEVAKSKGVLTVAVVSRPFSFEGKRRAEIAAKGIEALAQFVDSLITIPNEKLLPVLGKDIGLITAFNAVNDVLLRAVQGISELIIQPGLIPVDFADVRTVTADMGLAMMGTGTAKGENRATDAAKKAIKSPLLEDISLQGAQGVLVNVTGDAELTMGEFSEVGDTIREFASDDANVVVGTTIDPVLEDEIRVTVVATGLGEAQ